MNTGYIKIHRKICEWEWYTDSNTMRVFIHCLIKANHVEKKWQGIVIERGSFVTSYGKLAQELRLSVKQIRTSINKLKTTGEVAHKKTNKYSIIYIKNYNDYQVKDTQLGSQRAVKGQSEGSQRATTKNDKNDKNDNNDKNNIYIVENIDYESIKLYFNSTCTSLSKIRDMTETRKKNIKNRIKQYGKEALKTVIDKTQASDFLSGRNGKWVNCSFDWVIKKENFVKILEGNYDNKYKQTSSNMTGLEDVEVDI